MEVATDLQWVRIYWMRGSSPKGYRLHYDVKDPPCLGWQSAFLITGEKRSTLFCPYSMEAWTVRNTCAEIETMIEPPNFNRKNVIRIINENWAKYQSYGFVKAYDTAALVLKRLEAPVPDQLMKGGEEDIRMKGGKAVTSSLKKPVPPEGKRGKFLAWFLDSGGTRPIREAMAEFGISRSNALSYLYMLQKDHGIGYALVGDSASIYLPKGCKNPFTSSPGKKQKAIKEGKASKGAKTEEDDSWLNGTEEDDDSWLD